MEGGLRDQHLESTEDGVRQGAEGCVGDVPADTNTQTSGYLTEEYQKLSFSFQST